MHRAVVAAVVWLLLSCPAYAGNAYISAFTAVGSVGDTDLFPDCAIGGCGLSTPTLSASAAQIATYLGAKTLTFTNKTYSSGTLTGTFTGTYTLSGTPTINASTLNGTFTGTYTLAGSPTITNLPTPVNPTDAATKSYVDASVVAGTVWHTPVSYATAAVLPNSPTYSNGSSGVGATLTSGANAALVIDGQTVSTLTTRVLVQNQASAFQNGIYTLTTAGNGSTAWVLTRATDFNTAAAGNVALGASVLVNVGGTVNTSGFAFFMNQTSAITVGVTALNWVQIANNVYTSSGGITLTGTNFSLSAINGNSALVNSSASSGSPTSGVSYGATPAANTLAESGAGGSLALGWLALTQNHVYQGNGSSNPADVTLSAAIDAALGSTRGSILERGSGGWQIVAPSSGVGLCWQSQGTGADPIYASCAGGGVVSISSASPNIIVTPSPITGTGTVKVSNAETPENGATVTFSGTTACAGNDVSGCNPGSETIELQYALGAPSVSLPAASSTGFTSGFAFSIVAPAAEPAVITPTTSTINGGASLTLTPGQTAAIWTNAASTNYLAAVSTVSSVTALVDAGTVSVTGIGSAESSIFTWSPGASGNVLSNPTNTAVGEGLTFLITQPSSNGPYTVGWGTSYNWMMSPGIPPILNGNASATTVIDCVVTSTTGPVLWCNGPQNSAFNDVHPANPAGPTGFTTAGVLTNATMAGIGLTIVPTKTGNIAFVFSANIVTTDGTIAHGINYECSFGTGAVPGANGTLTGTQTGGIRTWTAPVAVTAADVSEHASCEGSIYGAALNTAIWLDVAQVGVGATGAKFTNAHITAWEVGQ